MFCQQEFQRWRELTITGLETFFVGFVFVFQNHFVDRPDQPLVHLSFMLGNFNWYVYIMILGVLMTLVGLLRIWKFYIDIIVTCLATGTWLAYFLAFLAQDFSFPHAGTVSLTTIFMGFVVVRLLVISYLDSRASHKVIKR